MVDFKMDVGLKFLDAYLECNAMTSVSRVSIEEIEREPEGKKDEEQTEVDDAEECA